MRQNQSQNLKRSRGRGRRNNNGQSFNRNTTFDSNGPEGRLRGNAQQLFEKYTALAHDANAAGERVSAEAFSQFADHYYRIQQTILQAAEQQKKAHEERRNQDSARQETPAAEPVQSETEAVAAVSDTDNAASSDGTEVSAPDSMSESEEKQAQPAAPKKRTRARKAVPKPKENAEKADEASEAVA